MSYPFVGYYSCNYGDDQDQIYLYVNGKLEAKLKKTANFGNNNVYRVL